jgi:hypothetical protein
MHSKTIIQETPIFVRKACALHSLHSRDKCCIYQERDRYSSAGPLVEKREQAGKTKARITHMYARDQ